MCRVELDPTDRLDLLECLGRYGRLIDARNWSALADVFTPDAAFDLTEIGGAVLSGIDEIRYYMAYRARHPVAHHVTNAHIENAHTDCVRTTCMPIAVQTDGSVASGLYADEFVRFGHALRIRRRVFRWLLAPRTKPT